MSNPNPDQKEQYIVTFRTAGGGEYRRCLEAYDIEGLAALILEEGKAHGSRFIDAELLE